MIDIKKNISDLLIFKKRAVPVIYQSEVAECGLACLAMIASFYGYKTNLILLRKRFPMSSHGATLRHIIQIGHEINLNSRALKLNMKDLSSLQLPCILHWNLGHFVVLKKVTKNYILINDPLLGGRKISIEEASKSFTGVALEAHPNSSFKKRKEPALKLNLKDFWTKIEGLKRNLIIIFILSILLQFFSILTPLYLQITIDDIIFKKDISLLGAVAIGFVALLFINLVTDYLRQTVILQFSSKINLQIAANVFKHLIRLPLNFFTNKHIGDVISRFGSLEDVREIFTTKLISAAIDGLLAIIMLVIMFFYSMKLTFIVIGISSLYIFLRLLFYQPIKKATEKNIFSLAKESSQFIESIKSIQTIKLYQQENNRQNLWQNSLVEAINGKIKLNQWQIRFDLTNKLLFGIENIIVIYVAATLIIYGVMSVGMIYAFINYKEKFISSINKLIETLIEFNILDIHLTRLSDIVYTEKEFLFKKNKENNGFLNIEHKLTGEIKVENLSFSYSKKGTNIFKNVSFDIQAGESVAIIGPSGCGKTTLLKCLMGLYRPLKGNIYIDGEELHSLSKYRTQIAGVMQNDELLTGTIADNIACFSEDIDMEKVQESASMACIDEEIKSFAMQYNTYITDTASNLSGGQKQRIMLARAFYREPKILFMDEATSHLDIENEKNINKKLSVMDITRIIVAHRPETINSADRIINLKNFSDDNDLSCNSSINNRS